MIEFPKLGLKFAIDRVAFQVFGIDIFWYGIIIAFGFLLAVLLAMKNSKKFGIEPENIIDLVLIAVPVSIVLARLYYVLFNWSEFSDNILSVFNTRRGGLAIYGGIIGAFLSAYFFARWKKIGVLKLFDLGVPYLVLAQAIGRWGNFVNQEAFGTNTTLPWGMTGDSIKMQLYSMRENLGMDVTPDLPVHPTFLYESLLNFLIFIFLILYRKKRKLEGGVFFLYMILYGIGRAFIEGIRTDSLMLGNFRVSQALGIILAITFTAVFIIRRKKAAEISAEEVVELGASSYGTVLRELEQKESVDNTETDNNNDSSTDVPNDNHTPESDEYTGNNAGNDKSEADIGTGVESKDIINEDGKK
ncbi:MAG: prolipoprotein diacylglyceryl transferase [Clostridia bacterium]|nr:prolipoprotein diacylglyceryl transferase [Clostridia bacterium]